MKYLASITEAGSSLGVSRTTAYELVASGRLRTVKIGTRSLVPVGEIERFVAELHAEAGIPFHPPTPSDSGVLDTTGAR